MDGEIKLFDRKLTYPDSDAAKRLSRLVGIDEVKENLKNSLALLVNPSGLQVWAKKHHKKAETIIGYVERRPPLIILAGDVGTGKTELAETIGDAVSRQESIGITLFPLSLSTRGSGKVGEMTTLLSGAFEETFKEAQRLSGKGSKAKGGIIMLVDEGDALTQSREDSQMHHEDRAGVNAFIRGVDRLAEAKLPAVVILCTNRLSSIDPAVQRRAAEVFVFNRPNEEQRFVVLENPLIEVGFTKEQIIEIAMLTGPAKDKDYGFTYSDLTQRFLPSLVMDAYPNSPISFERTKEILKSMQPTAPFQEGQ